MIYDRFIGQVIRIGAFKYGENKENAFISDYQKLTFSYKTGNDEFATPVERVSFDFLNVLGDFVADVVTKNDIDYTITLKHPFFMGYLFNRKKELTEDEKKVFDEKEVYPPKMLLDYNMIFKAHQSLSKILVAFEKKLLPFEKIQSALNLTFSYSISKTDGKHILEHFYTIDDICADNEEKEGYDYNDFTYFCHNILDVVFAVLHCCIYCGYKFVKCNHCGKFFATKSLKQKYCTRKSSYLNYQHLECEPAVRNINQQLQRKKKRIYNGMTTYIETSDKVDKVNTFLDMCANYHDKIKELASIENLQAYNTFLSNYKDGENNGNDNKEK